MNTPEWLKPALWGAVGGGVALAIIGFSWGGWVTGMKAERMAADQAHDAVVAALAPICVAQAMADPNSAMTLAKLKDTSSYQRSPILMDAGWATMPGATEPDRAVARACMDTLAQTF